MRQLHHKLSQGTLLMPGQHPFSHSFDCLIRAEDETKTNFLRARAQAIGAKDSFEVWVESLSKEDLDPILRADEKSAQDFLLKQAINTEKTIPDYVVAVFLTMAHQWGWDKDRLLTEKESYLGSRENIPRERQESFLEWLIAHQGEGLTSLKHGQQWPTNAQEFHAFDTKHNPPRDHEWLCAWVIASGVNPWDTTEKGSRTSALENSLTCGHPGIALQLLSLPGAPALWKTLNEKSLFYPRQTLAQYLTDTNPRRNGPKPGFSWVIENTTGVSNVNIKNHTPTSLSILLIEHLETSQEWKEEAYAILQKLWRKHLNQKELSTTEYVSNLVLLPKNAHWKSEEKLHAKGRATVDLLLNAAWGESMGREVDDDPNPTTDIEWFFTVHSNERFPGMKWTPIHARALRHLVSHDPRSYGLDEFPWEEWTSTQNHLGQSIPNNTTPNVLGGALNQPIGGGLFTKGLWFLIFFGKKGHSPWDFNRKSLEYEFSDFSLLDQEALLFGIRDWKTFFRSGIDSAVDLTEWILDQARILSSKKHGNHAEKNVQMALTTAWAQALHRFPSAIAESPESLLRLLRALASGQVTTWKTKNDEIFWNTDPHTYTKAWIMFMWNLWEHPSRHERGEKELESEAHEMLHTELLLTMHLPDRLESLPERVANRPQHLERVMEWISNIAPPLLEKYSFNLGFLLKTEHIKQLQLAINLPLPDASSSKKRF